MPLCILCRPYRFIHSLGRVSKISQVSTPLRFTPPLRIFSVFIVSSTLGLSLRNPTGVYTFEIFVSFQHPFFECWCLVYRYETLDECLIRAHLKLPGMPARSATFRCLCSRCCELDKEGVVHNPSGKLIPVANKAAHLQRVQLRLGISSEQCQQAVETLAQCHDRDIPPQPSHTYLCLLAVQTPPEQSLTKPEPTPGLPNPSIAFLNPSAAFPKGCCTNVCLVSIPEAVNTIPEHI